MSKNKFILAKLNRLSISYSKIHFFSKVVKFYQFVNPMLHILKALLSESYDKVVKVSSLCKVVRFLQQDFSVLLTGFD